MGTPGGRDDIKDLSQALTPESQKYWVPNDIIERQHPLNTSDSSARDIYAAAYIMVSERYSKSDLSALVHYLLTRTSHDQYARAEGLQAKVDELMWEYCPDDMTPEQKARWGECQVPVDPAQEPLPWDMTDEQRMTRLSDKYGKDNPSITLAALLRERYSTGQLGGDFWALIEACAAKCNELVGEKP